MYAPGSAYTSGLWGDHSVTAECVIGTDPGAHSAAADGRRERSRVSADPRLRATGPTPGPGLPGIPTGPVDAPGAGAAAAAPCFFSLNVVDFIFGAAVGAAAFTAGAFLIVGLYVNAAGFDDFFIFIARSSTKRNSKIRHVFLH